MSQISCWWWIQIERWPCNCWRAHVYIFQLSKTNITDLTFFFPIYALSFQELVKFASCNAIGFRNLLSEIIRSSRPEAKFRKIHRKTPVPEPWESMLIEPSKNKRLPKLLKTIILCGLFSKNIHRNTGNT